MPPHRKIASALACLLRFIRRPQLTQSTPLNLSLDKHTRIRYSLVKVLLTVSPSRSSFAPPPDVFSHVLDSSSQSRLPRDEILPSIHLSLCTSRELSPLFIAFTPNRSLTPLATVFTQEHRGGGVLVFSGYESRVTVTPPTPFPATHTESPYASPFAATHTKTRGEGTQFTNRQHREAFVRGSGWLPCILVWLNYDSVFAFGADYGSYLWVDGGYGSAGVGLCVAGGF